MNTSAPQGCVLSPALYTLFTNDCIPIHSSNTIIKFAEDTTVVGLISDNECHYRQEVQHMAECCVDNNLVLITSKTNEIIVDFRRSKRTTQTPLITNEEEVGGLLNSWGRTSPRTWAMGYKHLQSCKRAIKRLFFLWMFRLVYPHLLFNLYRSTFEGILCQGCSV